MHEAESHNEKHHSPSSTTPDAHADKFYVETSQGGILYRKLIPSRFFRAGYVHIPGLHQTHGEVQGSYLWAASEFGGSGLVLFSVHEFFRMSGALRIVFLSIGIPVALLLSLRRAIGGPEIKDKIGLAYLVALLGAGFSAMGLMVAFKTGFDKVLPNASYAIVGLVMAGLSWLLFTRFVPTVGGYILDTFPVLPFMGAATLGHPGATAIKSGSVMSAGRRQLHSPISDNYISPSTSSPASPSSPSPPRVVVRSPLPFPRLSIFSTV